MSALIVSHSLHVATRIWRSWLGIICGGNGCLRNIGGLIRCSIAISMPQCVACMCGYHRDESKLFLFLAMTLLLGFYIYLYDYLFLIIRIGLVLAQFLWFIKLPIYLEFLRRMASVALWFYHRWYNISIDISFGKLKCLVLSWQEISKWYFHCNSYVFTDTDHHNICSITRG